MQKTYTIKQLQRYDIDILTDMLLLFQEAFKMEDFSMPATYHLKRILQDDHFTAFYVQENDKVIAAATVYTLEQYYKEKPFAYIFDLAVRPDFQRKGIGSTLIGHIKAYYSAAGFDEVFVQADKNEDEVLQFYRTTGFTIEEDVSHFYYRL